MALEINPSKNRSVKSQPVSEPRESGALLNQRYQERVRFFLAGALVLACVFSFIAFSVISKARIEGQQAIAEDRLLLQVETLNSILEKPRLVPVLLAQDAQLLAMFDRNQEIGQRIMGDEKLRRIASLAAVRDILLFGTDGTVFTSALNALDGQKPFASAFEAAMQGRLGRLFFANEPLTPFYVFAAPARHDNEIVGVIMVEVYLNEVLAAWALVRNPVLVTDGGGRILFSNRPSLRGLQFADGQPSPEIAYTKQQGIFIENIDTGPSGLRHFVESQRYLPLLDWTLHVLVPVEPARAMARLAASIAFILPLLIGFALWFFARRAYERKSQERRERAEALRLERQVRDRTADLRNAQQRLVQSAKLAAIGQLSATLAHEYNQPLAAIEAHASNAQAFMERGMGDKAEAALGDIQSMVRRLDELSRTLMSFARKPGTDLRFVSLETCLNEAEVLVAAIARNSGVKIIRDDNFNYDVLGGQVRFTQVFVNLFKNAIDAIADQPIADQHQIKVSLGTVTPTHIDVVVEDNGPGIPAKYAAQIFEPFFTTKDVGRGLGIGLSIVYNTLEDAGADIRYERNAPNGARFIISFQRAALHSPDGDIKSGERLAT